MSSNAVQEQIDITQLTKTIREQIGRTSNVLHTIGNEDAARPVVESALARLRSAARELDSLASQLEKGEPSPPQLSFRGRLGFWVKRRLYRLLWWHSYQVKALSDRLRETINSTSVLSEHASRQVADIRQSISECKRQVYESENRLQQLESAQLRLQAAEVERKVKESVQLEAAVASLREQLTAEFADRIETAIGQQNASQQQDIMARISDLGAFTHQTRTALTLQERRLTLFIEEARKRLPEPLPNEPLMEIVRQHDNHKYDSVYVAFEDLFRGSREEIKARQAIYLPLLGDSGIGSAEMSILDLGCGRGEWLELLRENGMEASGVDRNDRMVECCRSRGFQVTQSDALPYLRTLPDASLGAVTSFHMVEHLPFEATLALVDECLRVLRSGGILILETPNPQNILVGAYAFYFDPSHVKPLPSPMLRFFVEARGFCNVYVQDLHPYPELVRFPDDGKGISNRLNDYFYGPQDYAVIGRKP